jgi:hypothetical protein
MMQTEQEEKDTAATTWIVAKIGREPVAYQRKGENIWRIPTQTPQFKERVGLGKDPVKQYGQAWVQHGLVIPDSEGKSTHYEQIPNAKVRLLLIPEAKLKDWKP